MTDDEASQFNRIVYREERNDCIQFNDKYDGAHPSVKMWVATFPKHRAAEAAVFAIALSQSLGCTVQEKP